LQTAEIGMADGGGSSNKDVIGIAHITYKRKKFQTKKKTQSIDIALVRSNVD
jgi:hypothetical protein